jgi:GAF domain-containing protein
MSKPMTAALAAVLLAGCATTPATKPATGAAKPDLGFAADPYPSTYARVIGPAVLLQHATVLTGTGTRLDDADVLMRDGKIVAVGNASTHPPTQCGWTRPASGSPPASSTCIRTWACIPARA